MVSFFIFTFDKKQEQMSLENMISQFEKRQYQLNQLVEP